MPASGQTASIFLPPLRARHETPASAGRHKAGIRASGGRPHSRGREFDGNLQTRGGPGRREMRENNHEETKNTKRSRKSLRALRFFVVNSLRIAANRTPCGL